jgi:hypothetical protein
MNKLFKNFLFWIGAVVIIFVFCKNKPFYITILWILAWGCLDGIINGLFAIKHQKKNTLKQDPRFDTPRKALTSVLNYRLSNLLFVFNPLLLLQSVLQIIGMLCEKVFGRPVLEVGKYSQQVDYKLPVAGEWCVFNGGVTKETSHSWDIPGQRFAYDLIKYGQNERSFDGDGRRLENYFCFDAPILAPADGVVIKARGDIRDAPYVGNSVLIKHADGEYCLLAHLKRGSVKVKIGEMLKQGQEIGRCGNSGNSTEPHLHFQFQNGKSFYFNSGIPVKFSGFSRKNDEQKIFVKRDYISKNTFILVGE